MLPLVAALVLAVVAFACGGGGSASVVAPPTPTPLPLVTDTFAGTTEVGPEMSFRANRSQPPFAVANAQSVSVQVTFVAPADCSLVFSDCPPAGDVGLANCLPATVVSGSAGSASWTADLPAGSYQVALTLAFPRSRNGPLCQAFSGTIPFSGQATHH